MKGLGHSILLLVDGEGCGRVFSFNGMQYSLGKCLLGKRGIGKMSTGLMTADETEAFLHTGNLKLDGDQLTGNYDMALYRPITAEDYQVILEQSALYIVPGEQFEELYAKWAEEADTGKKEEYRQELEQMGEDETLPLYQIYTNNCDDAARMLASAIDAELRSYSNHTRRITPNGNLKAFGAGTEKWGVMKLGRQTLPERILMFLVIF